MYKSESSLNYIASSLETVLTADVPEEESLRNLLIVIIHEYDPQLSEKDSMKLSQKGQDLARKYGSRLRLWINICSLLHHINVNFSFVFSKLQSLFVMMCLFINVIYLTDISE